MRRTPLTVRRQGHDSIAGNLMYIGNQIKNGMNMMVLVRLKLKEDAPKEAQESFEHYLQQKKETATEE
ncbi:MAG: hypothetical protein ACLR1P_10760 [Oscillospiraceae bacterium]